jgi:hypothetical protein
MSQQAGGVWHAASASGAYQYVIKCLNVWFKTIGFHVSGLFEQLPVWAGMCKRGVSYMKLLASMEITAGGRYVARGLSFRWAGAGAAAALCVIAFTGRLQVFCSCGGEHVQA